MRLPGAVPVGPSPLKPGPKTELKDLGPVVAQGSDRQGEACCEGASPRIERQCRACGRPPAEPVIHRRVSRFAAARIIEPPNAPDVEKELGQDVRRREGAPEKVCQHLIGAQRCIGVAAQRLRATGCQISRTDPARRKAT